MTIHKDIKKDFDTFKQQIGVSSHCTESEILDIFKRIHSINYLSFRTEVSETFNNIYYKMTLSSIKEAFLLFNNNFVRAASLVLRSGIENYLKFLLHHQDLPIHKRVFQVNHNTLNDYLKTNYHTKPNYQKSLTTLNARLLSYYKKLSGLSHSLTKESKFFIITFLEDIHTPKEYSSKKKNFLKLYIGFLETVNLYNLFYCTYSLKNWNLDHLKQLLSINMGNKRLERILKVIKKQEDIEFHHFEIHI